MKTSTQRRETMSDKAAVCNFPQALNKQKTMNRVSPPCTRARDENCFKSLAYDPAAAAVTVTAASGGKSGRKHARTAADDEIEESPEAKRMCTADPHEDFLEMGLQLIKAIALETDIDNSADVTKSVMKIMQAVSCKATAPVVEVPAPIAGESESEPGAECRSIHPKALANAIYYMIDVLFGNCDSAESVTRLIMLFIDASRRRMADAPAADSAAEELDNIASSLFIYIATNRASMRPSVSRR